MTSILPTPRGTTIFHVPIGDGLDEPIAIANNRIDPSIVAAEREPLLGRPEYLDAAQKLITEDRWKSRRIFVTSPTANDGKTRTAFNLAAALASPTRSVLLAEINFTRPGFRALLGQLRFRYGIDTAVSGETKPAEAVITVGDTGLSLAPIKRAAPEDKLERRLSRLDDFFRWANDNYELLILDCPAVVSSDWHSWFHAYIGEALLVIRQHRTPVAELRKAVRLLENHLVGGWFNREQQEPASLAQENHKPLSDVFGQSWDHKRMQGINPIHTPQSREPWSRETQRAISLLNAYGSAETKPQTESGPKPKLEDEAGHRTKDEADQPTAYVRQK